MNIVIEIVGRSGTVIERHRFNRFPVSLGRAYRNDLVLTDPYVDPFHCELNINDEGELIIRDLSSRNGTLLADTKLNNSQQRLLSGAAVNLGKSHIQVFDVDHPQPQALPLSSMEAVFNLGARFWVVVLAFVLLTGTILVEKLMHVLGSFRWLEHLGEVLVVLFLVVGYAGFWALLGRVLRHDSRFLGHCMIVILGLLGVQLGEHLLRWLAFNSNLLHWLTLVEFVWAGLMVLFLLRSSLFLATHLKQWHGHLVALVPALALVFFGVFHQLSEQGKFRSYPLYSNVLFSPLMQLGEPQERQQFLEESVRVFEFVDEQVE